MSSKAVLYTGRVCPFAQRADIAAAFKGFTGESVYLDPSNLPEWYIKQVNYRETIPCLKLPNGKCYSESAIIAQYFDDAIEPKHQLFPASAEVRRRILEFTANSDEMIWAGYGAVRASAEDQKEANEKFINLAKGVEARMSTTSAFAVTETFSFADLYLIPFVLRFKVLLSAYAGLDLAKVAPRLASFADACLAVPAVASTIASSEFFVLGYGESYAKGKAVKWNYKLYANELCPYSERVRLTIALLKARNPKLATFFSDEEVALGDAMPESYKKDVNSDGDLPVLQIPTGEKIASSLNAVQYLAEQFNADVGIEGVVPTDAEALLEGRYFVDSANRVFDEIGSNLSKKEKNFAVSDDVAFELGVAEKTFTAAGPVGKTYLTGSTPTYFDLEVLPFLHRVELLLGSEKLASYAPNLTKALIAARADPALGSVFVSSEKFFA